MAFFKKRGPQGRQLGVSEGNLMRIYEMTNLREYMRGGGWCSISFGDGAPFPVASHVAVDVWWETARADLDGAIELMGHLKKTPPDSVALADARAELGRMAEGQPFERTLQLDDGRMHYWLIRTDEAADRGAVVEAMIREGGQTWMERARVPRAV
jgi:hypothetical protein